MKKYEIREIAKLPIPPYFTKDLISVLTKLCFYESPISSCDLLFVFGSNILHKEIGKQINTLLHAYNIPKVIITGGIADYRSTFYIPKPESEIILSYIEVEKFRKTAFIIENKSKNTLDNVVYTKELLHNKGLKRICFISHSHASMRALLTLKKYCPAACYGNIPISIPSDIDNITVKRENWFNTDMGRRLVWGEYLRLSAYGTRGDFSVNEILDQLSAVDNIVNA